MDKREGNNTLGNPVYSVVIPMKNEAENIVPLLTELDRVMGEVGAPWELIYVNDGSTDTTETVLKREQASRPHLHIVKLAKNYGQSAALSAGFERVSGEFVITLDGDGQNDPADIPRLIAIKDNYDLICGIRKKRRDTWVKRWISRAANAVRGRCCRDGVQDTGCSLKLYRRSCLEKIKMYQGMHRFLPALFVIEGFRVGEIPVNHRERQKGVSHYSFSNRSFNTVFDLFAVMWMQRRHLKYEVERE